MVAFHYLDEVEHDVRAVVGLLSDQTVEVSGGPGRLGPGDVFFFGVNAPEGRLDVGASEVVLAFFESQFGQDAGGGYFVVSGRSPGA